MNWHKVSPAILTLLIFLLAQGIGTILIFGIGMLTSPEFNNAMQAYLSGQAQSLPLLEMMSITTFSVTLAAVNILAILLCHFILRNIRFVTACDIASISWKPGTIAIAAGILCALCISIITEKVELPDVMQQISIAMSHNIWGLMTITIIGPITEELIFREAIEGEMLRRGANPWMAITISALAFSIAHLNLAQSLYAFPLALLFGIIYYKTGNIVLTALLHILNNGIVALQLHTLGEDINNLSYSQYFGSTTNTYVIMLLSGILCITLTKVFWDSYQPNTKPQK